MNYRHAFHAGNFADVHKHAVLARILVYLRQKPTAFRVIDTHAGAGHYDLLAEEATRAGEWREGIARLWQASGELRPPAAAALLAPYLDAIAAFNPGGRLRAYPGSPLIALQLLRSQDRLIACELEPQAANALGAALHGERRAKTLALDGWTALGANVPPKERRGVVLIDPSFEDGADFARLSEALRAAHRKWPTGVYLLWYPIKVRQGPDILARRLKKLALPKVLRCELLVQAPRAEGGLAGSGLIVVNPPFMLEQELRLLLPALGRVLSPRPSHRLDWLRGEPSRPLLHPQKLV